MFKTLYSRIAIYTVTVIIFSAFISFFIANIYYHFNLKENNDAKIMRTLKEARTYENQLPSKYSNSYFQHLGQMNYQVVTVNKQGHKIFYGEPFRKDTLSSSSIKQVIQGHDYHGIKNKPFELFVTGFFDNETDNTVGVRFYEGHQPIAVFMRPDIGKTFGEFRIFLFVLLIFLLFISISLVIASTYSIIKPIKELKIATEQLMNGNFEIPISRTRRDEIGTLQFRFDTMRQSLKQLDDMRQHFVQNVSHEIKTPLTHIRRILTELQSTHSEDERNILINDIHLEITRLSNLIKELLLLSELDNANHLSFDDKLELSSLITDIIRHEQYAIDDKSLMLLSDMNKIYFQGNRRLLHQAFSNLIQNAIKYSNIDGIIDITLNQENNHIIFKVTNEGQTISKQALPHLFDRFYKLNASDSSNGLGLAITKSIIDLHKGKIVVSSDSEKGTTFKILFPNINPLNQSKKKDDQNSF